MECTVFKVLKLIGGRWTMNILHELCGGKKRFGELAKELKGISPKTLSERLHQLEKSKIVKKKVFAEIPLHVEYSLTPKGIKLKSLFAEMEKWGKLK